MVKHKIKAISPLSFFPDFTLSLLTPLPHPFQGMQGDGKWGLWSVCDIASVGPFTGLQFRMNLL